MAIRKSAFNKFLKSMSEEELRSEMAMLFSRFKEVKTHYAMELGSEKDRKKIYDKAKKDIAAKYKTKSYRKPKRPRIRKVNAILKDLLKVSVFKEEMADLYLYNCEQCLSFMDDYCYYSGVLYNNVQNSFRSAIDLIKASMTEEVFSERCESIIEKGYYASTILGDAMNEMWKEIE